MRTKFSGILTLIMAFAVQLTFAQEKTVTGTVTDAESGLPLAGVNIVIEGTTSGTQTDFDGNYSIQASAGQTLVFTYVGYADLSVTVGQETEYNVSMEAAAAELEGVVVTAFGIERQEEALTYSTETIDSEELSQAAPVNPVTALQGKSSGLNILTKNNGVNPTTTIVLRGYNSITSSNGALIVINGTIRDASALNDLNPNDIATSTILKGPSATALYGSEGANGAVVITTKKGGDKGLTVNVNSSVTLEEVKYFPELQTKYGSGLDLHTYVPYENTQWGPRFDGQVRRIGRILPDGSFQTAPYAPVEDNRKDFFQTGITFSNGFNISGGDEKTNFYFSARRSDVTGIVPKDTYTKDNFRLSASRTEGDFKISTNVSYFRDEEDVHGATAGYQGRGIYWNIINTPSNIPLTKYKNWRTDKFAGPDAYYNEYYQNPYMLIDIARDLTESSRFSAGAQLEYEFTDWLSASYQLNGTFFRQRDFNTDEAITYNPLIAPSRVGSNTPASVFERIFYQDRITSDFLINIDKDINEDFNMDLILGNSVRTFEQHLVDVTGNNLFVPDLYSTDVRRGELLGQNDRIASKKVGYLADLTIGFREYLYLNGAYRYDVSSTLPLDNNGYSFYVVGLSAVLSEAIPGLKGDAVNFLKVSGSYSKTGNDPTIGFINELFFPPSPGFPYGNLAGLHTPVLGTSDSFKPEILTSYEFGFQSAFWDNRISLNATYFHEENADQFIIAGTSTASGISNFNLNSAVVENKGIEIDLGLIPIRSENFQWNIDLRLTKLDNEVTALAQGTERTQVGLAFTDGSAGVFAQIGKPFPALYGTAYERDPQGRVIIDPATGDPEVASEPKYFGSVAPDLILGATTSFEFFNFRLAATADYQTGHVYYNSMVNALEFTGSTQHSASANRKPFVFPNSSYPDGNGGYVANTNILTSSGDFGFWNGSSFNAVTENYVSDATFLKLREVVLDYNLPKKFLENTFLKEVTFGIVARNLVMLRSAENVYTDPEFTTDDQEFGGFGTIAQLPPTANYGFKVNLQF
jgi:TonB-linked SusC/RagA family outer membrane protein